MRGLLFLFLAGPLAWPQVAVIAHRGEHLHHPENTIPAYQAAVDLGADYFEVDVRTTADGHLVLLHGAGKVAESKFAELGLPTFDQALALARGKVGVYVDVKRASANDVVAAIEKRQMQDHAVIYGGAALLKEIAALRPQMKVMPEARNPVVLRDLLAALHLRVVAFDANDFNDETIAVARQAKADIFVDRLGPADNPTSWQDAVDRGATGIQTDHPGELVQYLRAKKLHR